MPIHPTYRTSHGLTEEMRRHLSREGNVILATLNDDGTPHLTELLFLLDDQDRIQMPTPHNTRKYKNL
ncbi:MAG TPA: pyridoxamine 5'-phosphate oxidase family protein, partial [Acidimicrobiia bacterium]|nr:pyridoxamine 5'-phosphate oxidase family protein [Acidimicrobiia bacterium]